MEKKNSREESLMNFKKARTHLDKIVEMVEGGEYCIDVMQQNLAVIGLLRSAHEKLMEGHLKGCFATAVASSNNKKKEEMVEEILRVNKLFNK
jgi:DNA-binding FrmR family transcriptional regulator